MFEFLNIRGTPVERSAQNRYSELLKEQKEHTLSRAKKDELKRVEGPARRLATRRIVTGTGILGLAGASAGARLVLTRGAEDQVMSDLVVGKFRLQIDSSIDRNRVEVIRKAASDWNNIHGCNRTVKVELLVNPGPNERLSNGSQAIELENADPGIIRMSSMALRDRDVMIHAMSHACVPDERTRVEGKMILRDGFQVTEYRGLGVVAYGSDGQEKIWTCFEEADAERNALMVDRTYKTGTISNAFLRDLVINKLPATSTYVWNRTNDVPAFVRAFNNLPSGTPVDVKILQETMIIFQAARDKGR